MDISIYKDEDQLKELERKKKQQEREKAKKEKKEVKVGSKILLKQGIYGGIPISGAFWYRDYLSTNQFEELKIILCA